MWGLGVLFALSGCLPRPLSGHGELEQNSRVTSRYLPLREDTIRCVVQSLSGQSLKQTVCKEAGEASPFDPCHQLCRAPGGVVKDFMHLEVSVYLCLTWSRSTEYFLACSLSPAVASHSNISQQQWRQEKGIGVVCHVPICSWDANPAFKNICVQQLCYPAAITVFLWKQEIVSPSELIGGAGREGIVLALFSELTPISSKISDVPGKLVIGDVTVWNTCVLWNQPNFWPVVLRHNEDIAASTKYLL